jgi:hypothetical protein
MWPRGYQDRCQHYKVGDVEVRLKNGRRTDRSTNWVFPLTTGTTYDGF